MASESTIADSEGSVFQVLEGVVYYVDPTTTSNAMNAFIGSKERVRIPLSGKHCSLQAFVKHVVEHAGLREEAQKSINMILRGLKDLHKFLDNLNPAYNVDLHTCLTVQVENLHAMSHFKDQLQTTLQYARNLANTVYESIKRVVPWAADLGCSATDVNSLLYGLCSSYVITL